MSSSSSQSLTATTCTGDGVRESSEPSPTNSPVPIAPSSIAPPLRSTRAIELALHDDDERVPDLALADHRRALLHRLLVKAREHGVALVVRQRLEERAADRPSFSVRIIGSRFVSRGRVGSSCSSSYSVGTPSSSESSSSRVAVAVLAAGRVRMLRVTRGDAVSSSSPSPMIRAARPGTVGGGFAILSSSRSRVDARALPRVELGRQIHRAPSEGPPTASRSARSRSGAPRSRCPATRPRTSPRRSADRRHRAVVCASSETGMSAGSGVCIKRSTSESFLRLVGRSDPRRDTALGTGSGVSSSRAELREVLRVIGVPGAHRHRRDGGSSPIGGVTRRRRRTATRAS